MSNTSNSSNSNIPLKINLDINTLGTIISKLPEKQLIQLFDQIFNELPGELFFKTAELTLTHVKIEHDLEEDFPSNIAEEFDENLDQYWSYLNYLKSKNGTTGRK